MAAHVDTPSVDDMLLPLIPTPSSSSSRRIQQRQPYSARMSVALSNQVLTALNHMSVSLSSPKLLANLPSSQHQANARQQQHSTISRCHDRIYHACQRFRRLSCGDRHSVIDDSTMFNDLDKYDHNINDHGYTAPRPALMITASKVSLPDHAGTAELLNVLPPHLQAVYSNPQCILRRPCEGPIVSRKAFMCSHSEYVSLLSRMQDRDMISFTDKPLAINGLFGVDKDNGKSIRLIIDARPVNSMFIPSPPVSLPTPDLVAALNVPQATTLYAAKVDLDNFYHRIRIPESWWPYFALPYIRAGDLQLSGYPSDALVYPCCKTLPMGFSHSVFLAQAVHEHIIDTRVPLLHRESRIVRHPFDITKADTVIPPGSSQPLPLCTSQLQSPTGDFDVNRMRHSVYIDDLNIYYHDPLAMQQAMDQYLAAMCEAKLPAKPSKIAGPTADGIECLGVFVDGVNCEVGLSVPKLQVLRASTLRLLDIGECTGRELSHIVGRWTWAMLVRRPAMSVFNAVYRFIECARDSRYILWPSVRRELWAAAHLAPLLFASICCEWSSVVIASDASEVAAGVVYTRSNPGHIKHMSVLPDKPGEDPHPILQSFVQESDWKIAISHPWYEEEHINSLEVRSSLSAIKWSIRSPDVLVPSSINHIRLLLLVDSSATLGSINKGRSSAHRLLRPLRTMSSLLLAAGIYLKVKWIPSALNPADKPSRFHHQ